MTSRDNLFSAQDLAGARSAADSKRAVFKIFSDTLRPPSKLSEHHRSSLTKPNVQKVNKKSPRTVANSSYRSEPCFLHQTKDNSSSFLSRKFSTIKKKCSGKFAANKKRGPGASGEGNCLHKSLSLDQGTQSNFSYKAPMKDCHLNNVLRSARRCLKALRDAKESLSDLVAQDEQLCQGVQKLNPTQDHLQLANVASSITNLCRECFVPAHRLNQTAIALYMAEDFLRYPSDLRSFDPQSSRRRIKLPDMTFNSATVMRLRQVVDLAAATYNQFSGKGKVGEALQEILFCMLRAYQDFYAAALGCQEIFKVLLYSGQEEKQHLQQFLLTLSPIERSDLLVEIQELRRMLDEVVILLEKLSWGSFVIYRLTGGENISSASASSVAPSEDCPASTHSAPAMLSYPAYPLLKSLRESTIKRKKTK